MSDINKILQDVDVIELLYEIDLDIILEHIADRKERMDGFREYLAVLLGGHSQMDDHKLILEIIDNINMMPHERERLKKKL